MRTPAIPCFSFPTTVFMVDDSVEFLKSIAIGLPPERSVYNFYSDPERALKVINEDYEKNQFASGLVSLLDEEEFEHKTLDVNVRDLYRIMYNKSRFQQLSTVVVDFHMPFLDGIEFCRRIKNPNIQKILLTSIVDEKKAIDVLNAGLIHKFIRKQSHNVVHALRQAIEQAQQRYFIELSHLINKVVTFSPDESALLRPEFIEIFHQVVERYGAVEYYLTECLGSFVFLDADGNHYGLTTRSQEQIDSFCECAQAESAPAEVIAAIRSGRQLLCYHSEKTHTLPEGTVWEQYLFPGQKIPGTESYFYTAAPEMMDIKRKSILSFNDYISPMSLKLN